MGFGSPSPPLNLGFLLLLLLFFLGSFLSETEEGKVLEEGGPEPVQAPPRRWVEKDFLMGRTGLGAGPAAAHCVAGKCRIVFFSVGWVMHAMLLSE